MKKLYLFLFAIVFLGFFLLAKNTFSEEKNNPPFNVTVFMRDQPPNWFFIGPKGGPDQTDPVRVFRVQFRITDPSITALSTSSIYLYNQDKELVEKFTRPDSQGKDMQAVINIINNLNGLKPNKTYSLIFPYSDKRTKWKTAIAVLGTKDRCVVKTLPASEKFEDFEFKEKALVK